MVTKTYIGQKNLSLDFHQLVARSWQRNLLCLAKASLIPSTNRIRTFHRTGGHDREAVGENDRGRRVGAAPYASRGARVVGRGRGGLEVALSRVLAQQITAIRIHNFHVGLNATLGYF